MMKRSSASLCSGCWALSVMSALVLAHANSVLDNMTESASTTNMTSVPTQSDQVKQDHASEMVDNLFMILRSGRKPRDGGETGSGISSEDFPLTTSFPKEATTDEIQSKISADSAETDQILPHEPTREILEGTTLGVPTKKPWHDDETKMETTVFDLDQDLNLDPQTTTILSSTHPPSHSEVFTVGFFDTKSHGRNLVPMSPTPHELVGGDATSWGDLDYYEEITTTKQTMFPDLEDDITTTEMYEEDPTTTSPPPPPRTFRPFNPNPFFPPKYKGPTDPRNDDALGTSKSAGCQLGLVPINGTCRSQCEITPNYCYNGGQCFILEGTGTFCRCNIQEYVWHKGSRCESVITEFQVMCIAIGSSALTVLLLFMIIVCFAKKLHVLKTENNKLRKRSSKYRPSSEQHNDNFSLSTIAEGSNPNVRKLCDSPPHARALAYYDNIICQKTMSRYTWETKEEPSTEDDPNTQNKLEDAVKSPPPKEDESLNIQNSLTPKHENHKPLGEENSSEVNSLQNNMM